MDPQIHKKATMLLRELAGVPGAERDAWLRERCAGDAALLEFVSRMRSGQHSATLDATPQPSPASYDVTTYDAPAPNRPRRLGAFTILSVLGEGGMGMVYLAEQDNPRRRVALKVVRPGLISPRLLRRFELEAQVLGRLKHPGIAQIYEAGTTEVGGVSQPYFAMELVEGQPLTAWCSQRDLPVRERLELFVRVCQAVHHAHQKGIVHRDLKPGNILIDADAQPKVLDFGVARTMGEDSGNTLQTDVGQVVGTIPYMSPEQIAGDPSEIDTRSDVYTLGVILFELLSSRLPHTLADKTIPEAARIITETDPGRLSSVDPAYRGDLDTIAVKAMQKDKQRRYQSASELGEDVARFLRDEPILARPPSAVYQITLFARRNKALVGGIVATFAVLVLGVVGTAWQAARATAGQRLAQQARARAEAEAETSREINDFLTSMLSAASPEEAMGREVTARELIDAAGAGITGRFADRPEVELGIRTTRGQTYRALGEFSKAGEEYARALDLARTLYAPDDRRTLNARRNLAGVLADRGNFDEAEHDTRAIVADLTRLFGADDFDTAMAGMELARILQESGHAADAEPLFRHAIDVGERARGEKDPMVITAIHNLGTALKNDGRVEESIALLRRALRLREESLGPDHPDTLYSRNNLAAALQRSTTPGAQAEAEGLLRETLAARERILGPDHASTITTVVNLAVALTEAGQYEEALPLAERAYAGFSKALGEKHPKTMVALANLAYLYEDLGRLDRAEAMYRKAIAIRKESAGGRDPETWAPLNNLGMMLMKKGSLPEAEATFRELLGLCEAALPPDHIYPALFRNNFGECLFMEGRLAEARDALERSDAVIRKTFPPGHARVLRSAERLEALYTAMGEHDLAAQAHVRAQKP